MTGTPKLQTRITQVNLDKVLQYMKTNGYKTQADAVRAMVVKQLRAEGYNPVEEPERVN